MPKQNPADKSLKRRAMESAVIGASSATGSFLVTAGIIGGTLWLVGKFTKDAEDFEIGDTEA